MDWAYEKLYGLAQDFASIVHFGQNYGTYQYTHHLILVDHALGSFGFALDAEPHLFVAAWLHDVIEDTSISYEQIVHGFGQKIGDIVYAVTNEAGKNRRERHEKTYPKIRANRDALVIKLADRIANVEFSRDTDSGLLGMYRKEWPGFYEALFDPTETDQRVIRMWRHLGELLGEA